MMFNLLLVFTIVSVALVGSHAVTPEVYWNIVLPNSPMPKAVKELLDPEIFRDFDRYIASKDQLKDHPEKLYNYFSASKDQLKDHPEKLYNYFSASKYQLKDHPEKLYNYFSASKDELKDHPEKLYNYFSASKDELKDHPEKLYNYFSASKDELKDHPEKLYNYFSASKDELKDHPEKLYNYFSTSKDELKDHPEKLYNYFSASKDQLKDHPEKLYNYFSASKDELKDHPEKLYNYFSASKDELKDHPEKLYNYFSASKDELKDHPEKLYNYFSASKDELKDHPEKLYNYFSASKDELKDHPEKLYNYFSTSKDELKDDPNAALLFLENDLYQGKEIKMHLTKKDQKSLFLPQKIADSIPFSSKNLTRVYNMFSVKPDSVEAEIMKRTLSLCEHKGNEGEEKYCATSLESMVDFSTTKLGKKVKAISTEVNAEESTTFSKYKIEGAKKLATNKAVVCHKQNYAYAVFYCHTTDNIKAYAVSLVGENDTKVNALAVCHTDTSKWNPQHLAFQVLKVKPGGVPVCHFLPEDHVVWVPLLTTNSA